MSTSDSIPTEPACPNGEAILSNCQNVGFVFNGNRGLVQSNVLILFGSDTLTASFGNVCVRGRKMPSHIPFTQEVLLTGSLSTGTWLKAGTAIKGKKNRLVKNLYRGGII